MEKRPVVNAGSGSASSGSIIRTLFRDDFDGKTFESLVSDGIDRFGHRVHAYCWMPNHVHMVIGVSNVPLSRIMQNLAFRYTRHMNDRYGRTGALFQGRYRAVLVDGDSYLVQLVRYVHRNPVAGGLCNGAHRYRWSSHRAYLGLDPKPWLDQDLVLSMLGPTREAALEAYRDFMAWPGEGPNARAMDFGFEDGILGDADFRASVLHSSVLDMGMVPVAADDSGIEPGLEALAGRVAEMRGVAVNMLKAPGRARALSEVRHIIAYLAFEHGVATLSDASTFFGRDLTTISRGVERVRRRLREDATFNNAVQEIAGAALPGAVGPQVSTGRRVRANVG